MTSCLTKGISVKWKQLCLEFELWLSFTFSMIITIALTTPLYGSLCINQKKSSFIQCYFSGRKSFCLYVNIFSGKEDCAPTFFSPFDI